MDSKPHDQFFIKTFSWDSDKNPKDFGDEMKLRISIEMMKRAYHTDRANLIFIFKLICESGLFNQEFIDYMLIYLLEISGLEMEEFMSIIKTKVTIDRDVEVKMISTADRLRQEGRQEGSYLKAVETCKKLLLLGLSPSVVSNATDLPLEKVLEIQKSLAN